MAIDPTLYVGYMGPNKAHVAFKREIVAAKVRAIHSSSSHSHLEKVFKEQIDAAGKGAKGSFSVGIVTEVISPTQMRLLHIPSNEASLIIADFALLESQFRSLMYCDLQRILESFLLDLIRDIALTDRRIMASSRTITFDEAVKADDLLELLVAKHLDALSHSNREDLEKSFERMGVPIIPRAGQLPDSEREFLEREFRLLWGIRNLIQHNHSIVNLDATVRMPEIDFAVGAAIIIDVVRLGRAFAAVEGIADNLNQRAVDKFPILNAGQPDRGG